MRVSVKGELDRGMPGEMLDVLRVRATSKQDREAAMPEIVNFRRNLELADRVRQIAAEKDATPGQLALAWLLYQGDDIVPIPGTKRRKYLEENVVATEVTLTEEDLERMEDVTPKGAASGDRYPDMSRLI